MKHSLTLLILLVQIIGQLNAATIKGQLQDADGAAVEFANVALYSSADNSMAKAGITDEAGLFGMQGIEAGSYYLVASFVGYPDLRKDDITLSADEQLDLGVLAFGAASVELSEVTVKASRAMVEVKPDRTVFNVEGTINSVGDDALGLLRKAPGVTVDNNDNINVLGRSGVLLYVDGKRLPLTGDDLSNYLQNLPAEQIDRFDIITNPGAKYEAEGNAGIIDIRLKRDKSLGANGSLSGSFSHGRHHRYNLSGTGNYRNKAMNIFGTLGTGDGAGFNDLVFRGTQNGFLLDEEINIKHDWDYYNYRLGTDFFLSDKHTLGFLINGGMNDRSHSSTDRVEIALEKTPTVIDSILVAGSEDTNPRDRNSFNVNYRFDNKKERTVNIDLDYGKFKNDSERFQPNQYYDATEQILLSEVINNFETPSDIDIYTAKLDFEDKLLDGKIGLGSKFSKVISDNTFLFFDVLGGNPIRNDERSNIFKYDEMVYAGYVNYSRQINDKWSFSAGLRAEQTEATGDLKAFKEELQEPPVELSYLDWFPSAGLTWQVAPMHTLALNYGRRINRPDYEVLNPFNNRLSELSYQKGNPFLNPEIVNNIELGYTLKYRYNFKLAYSKTTDQITRLIAPDEVDPRAGFITWENLAKQTTIGFNASLPMQFHEKWNAYFNLSASYLDNQADYGEGAVVDLQAFTYNIYSQHTFDLPWKLKGEISGWFSGPGIWGGVFKYDTSWSLNAGLQRRFLQDRLNVKLGVSDIFFESGWSGTSAFNGLESTGRGNWDSRRGSISISYRFGNQNVKSRKRKTGLEDEADRVGSGGNQ